MTRTNGNGNGKQTRSERLFAIEQELRTAAVNYADNKTNENRERLRTAALAYAKAAALIDAGSK
jgi:hypothetical protein